MSQKPGPLTIKQRVRAVRKKLSKPTVRVAARVLAWVYAGYMHLTWRTSRIELYGLTRAAVAMKRHRNLLITLWHENVVLTPWAYRQFKPTTLASRSDIGEVISACLKRQGYRVFRGGSSKGKSRRTPVLKEMIQYVKDHQEVMLAIAVDGSSGPVRELKPGIIAMANETRAPIFAVHAVSARSLRARTWDRTRFPMPFGRIVIVMQGPLRCDDKPLDGTEFRRLRDQAQLLLDDAADRAEHFLKHGVMPPPSPDLDLDPSYGEEDRRVSHSMLLPSDPIPNPRYFESIADEL